MLRGGSGLGDLGDSGQGFNFRSGVGDLRGFGGFRI